MHVGSPAMAHMYIVQPGNLAAGLLGLMSTHPPVAYRVARLMRSA
jgi:Zn-dependent protease with chaperone function